MVPDAITRGGRLNDDAEAAFVGGMAGAEGLRRYALCLGLELARESAHG